MQVPSRLVPHQQRRCQSILCLRDLLAPDLKVPLLIHLQPQAYVIVFQQILLEFLLLSNVLGELLDGVCDSFEEMASPYDFTGLEGHVSDQGRFAFGVVVEVFGDVVELGCVEMQDLIEFILKTMLQRTSFQNLIKLFQQFQGMLNIRKFNKIIINKFLQLIIQPRYIRIPFHIIIVELYLMKFHQIMAEQCKHLHSFGKCLVKVLNSLQIMFV